jgi:hypothetical protein
MSEPEPDPDQDAGELSIPPPRADRQPLRTNLLNAMQKSGMSLTPLFPYMHAGALIPAGTLIIGGPEADYGHFYHHNAVDEIIVAFVSDGATLRTGQVYVGGRIHGVNSFLEDEHQPGSYALFSVTQRQLEQGEQREAMSVLCEQCRAKVFEYEYDATPPPGPAAHELDHPFEAHRGSIDAMDAYNASEAQRTCPECGHLNREFPSHSWGWQRYATQAELMVAAKRALYARAEGSES